MSAEKRRILITVKTYPNPSRTYDETVCTAGIDLETRRFVRLYPIRFRHLDYGRWFSKYDILEMNVTRHKSDNRQDTFTPDVDSIRKVGHIKTGSKRNRDWAERNEIVLPLVRSLEDLIESAPSKECSLGIVPMREVRFFSEPAGDEWTPKELEILQREQLFGRKLAPLERIPWKLYYEFRCSEDCPGHTLRFFDWEAYQLYRNQRDRHDEDEAIADVLHQYHVNLSEESKDLHLFVGTHRQWQHEFMGIGLYYPPR